MTDLWSTLLPLIIGSAVLPLQIAVTILLLRSEAGRITAVAWVMGMTLVRLAQGVVFGLVLGTGVDEAEGPDRPGPIASTLLLIIAVAFYISAARKWIKVPDEEAPPPRWMDVIGSASPRTALLAGVGVVAVSPKLWAFTLGAIGAIAEAGLGSAVATATYVVFIVAAESIHLGAIALAYLAPRRADVVLARADAALRRYDRPIMITLGLVFGTWFGIKALDGLGVL